MKQLLGHDFGRVPFGFHQVLAWRDRCICDRRFVDVAHDINCPEHGLVATLKVPA